MRFIYGRSLWYPILLQVKGKKTVNAVVTEIEKKGSLHFSHSNYKGLVLVGLKQEKTLEVWGQNVSGEHDLIATYPFTAYSGTLGPKLQEGDRQIPEGIYRIEYLNPNSSYHLSMKLDYPNEFDKAMGKQDSRERLGYDIFIHGKAVTIGCIPIGDAAIEKLFYMVSKIGRSNVRVILSPYDMRKLERSLDIPHIDWEDQLYDQIKSALSEIQEN
ncbi:MAG: L,D-transpeptidase family protein [Verrucomicrobiota bacterium]